MPSYKAPLADMRFVLHELFDSKTIADLEREDACNIIRAELMTVFNNALGGPVVKQIYITEMAIQ